MRCPPFGYRGVSAVAIASAGVCTALPAPAWAQDGAWGDGPMNSSYELLLGAAVLTGPAYLGSDERKSRALPQIAARWRNGWSVGLGGPGGAGGISYRFASNSALSWGLRLGLDRGRDESDADALRGMGDIKAAARVRRFRQLCTDARRAPGRVGARWQWQRPRRRARRSERARHAAGFAVGAPERQPHDDLGQHPSHAEPVRRYPPTSPLGSGYALYTASSGVRDVALQVGGIVALRADTSLFLGVTGRSLFGDAKDSPLVRQRTAASALASVAVRF
jgi:outer membrane protein